MQIYMCQRWQSLLFEKHIADDIVHSPTLGANKFMEPCWRIRIVYVMCEPFDIFTSFLP